MTVLPGPPPAPTNLDAEAKRLYGEAKSMITTAQARLTEAHAALAKVAPSDADAVHAGELLAKVEGAVGIAWQLIEAARAAHTQMLAEAS